MPKEDIDQAMMDAKHLESEEVPSEKQLADQYRADMENSAKAAKLLKPVRDTVSRRKKAPKSSK